MRATSLPAAIAAIVLILASPALAKNRGFESHTRDSVDLERICSFRFAEAIGAPQREVRSRSEDAGPPGRTRVLMHTTDNRHHGSCIINGYGRIHALDPFQSN